MRYRDPTTWMWLRAFESMERAERMHRRFFELMASRSLGPLWEPPVDVFQTPDGYCVLVALPGVDPQRIQVGLWDGKLVMQAARSIPRPCHGARMDRLEIPHGRFERALALPRGKYKIKEQKVENGCLVVDLQRVGVAARQAPE